MTSPFQQVVLIFACSLFAEHFSLENNFYNDFPKIHRKTQDEGLSLGILRVKMQYEGVSKSFL
jgi:hypothetical protein